MATEEELEQARRKHAAALARPYPNDFRPGDEERARRAELVRLATDARLKSPPAEGEKIVDRVGPLVVVEKDGVRRERFPQDDELSGQEPSYPLYGRVMAKRGPFLVIQTPHGSAQAYLPNKGDDLPVAQKAELAALDLADHVAVEGPLMGTKKGDAAVKVRSYRHVAKALRPPPEKWHGLKDVEKRYRERYVDLFANPEVAEVFAARSAIVAALRRFLDERGFLEVETPLLHSVRGGATAKPFTTFHNTLEMSLYLRIAPELYLKRAVVGGIERVYEINRNFRNEGADSTHSPGFVMIEAYQAYTDYNGIADLTQELIQNAAVAIAGSTSVTWADGTEYDLGGQWERLPMYGSLSEASGREITPETPLDELLAFAAESGVDAPPHATHGKLVEELWEHFVKPGLTRPTFVMDFPLDTSPLVREHRSIPGVVEKWDLYTRGFELATGYSELVDPVIQRERFVEQAKLAARGDLEAMRIDEEFLRALEHGMPPTGGMGMGVDRLLMAITGLGIRETILFPLVK